MRPELIAELPLPSRGGITHVDDIGWLVTHPADQVVTILGPHLRTVTRIHVPTGAMRFQASVNDRYLAVVTLDGLAVLDREGEVLWRRGLTIERAGLPCEPNCYLNAHGVLWVYLPNGDELAAFDAATGNKIDRAPLESDVGAACFWPHPDRKRLGLHVAMGQDGSLSWLAWMDAGRIMRRGCPGECLTGFTSTGERYLALPHEGGEIAIRDVATGAAVVACAADNIPGYQCGHDYTLMEAGALICDDFVLVAVADTGNFDAGTEGHLLLSTRALRWQASVDYAQSMTHNSIAATDGHGSWITAGHRDEVVRLWQLPDDPVNKESPLQQPLW